MEEKFARENAALKAELDGKSDSAKIQAMDRRQRSIEAFKMRAKAHVSEYRRELIRLEEQLGKVVPRVKEANTMGVQLGRCVKFEARMVTTVPESGVEDVLSPCVPRRFDPRVAWRVQRAARITLNHRSASLVDRGRPRRASSEMLYHSSYFPEEFQ